MRQTASPLRPEALGVSLALNAERGGVLGVQKRENVCSKLVLPSIDIKDLDEGGTLDVNFVMGFSRIGLAPTALQELRSEVTLVGIGRAGDKVRPADTGLVTQGTDVAFSQMHLGSVAGLLRRLHSIYFGRKDTTVSKGPLICDGTSFGTIKITRSIISDRKKLSRNGINIKQFNDTFARFIVAKICLAFSRQQIQNLRENAALSTERALKYSAPRPIFRTMIPTSVLRNAGPVNSKPAISSYAQLKDGPFIHSEKVEFEPIQFGDNT